LKSRMVFKKLRKRVSKFTNRGLSKAEASHRDDSEEASKPAIYKKKSIKNRDDDKGGLDSHKQGKHEIQVKESIMSNNASNMSNLTDADGDAGSIVSTTEYDDERDERDDYMCDTNLDTQSFDTSLAYSERSMSYDGGCLMCL